MAVEKNSGAHRFEPGHPRYGGRRKNTVQQARAIAAELGVEPLRLLMELVRDGCITKTVTENGKRKRVTVEVPLDMVVDVAKYVTRFLHPVLSAAQVQADVAVDVDAQVTALPVDAIMSSPKLTEALGELAMLMIDQEPRALLPSEVDRVMGS